jgi:hypothetical protein
MIAIVACLFLIGPHHCNLDAGRPTGDDWPATFGEDFFDFRGAKPAPAGGGKKPQGGCCGFKIEASLASLVFGQIRSNRGRKCDAHSGNREEYDNSDCLPPAGIKGMHGLRRRCSMA